MALSGVGFPPQCGQGQSTDGTKSFGSAGMDGALTVNRSATKQGGRYVRGVRGALARFVQDVLSVSSHRVPPGSRAGWVQAGARHNQQTLNNIKRP